MPAQSALGYSLAWLSQELHTQLSSRLPHTVPALTFSKDTILTFFNSAAATDHSRRADKFPPSLNTAELNQTISAWINEPWHKAG